MQDIISFFQSVDNRSGLNYPDIAVGFFNQHVLLYRLLKEEPKVSILEPDNSASCKFQIDFQNKEDLISVRDYIDQNSIFVIYESQYRIRYQQLDDKTMILNVF